MATIQYSPVLPPRDADLLDASASRKALAGFMVSGLLLSFPGAILPAWGHHMRTEYNLIANYFLFMNIGVWASLRIAAFILPRRGIAFGLSTSCVLAFAGIIYLSFVPPPFADWWRFGGFAVLGIAAGMLHTSIFQALTPVYQQNPAATVNLGGMFFGFGCLLMAILLAGTFNVYTVPSILFLVALVPGFFAGIFARARFPKASPARQRSFQQVTREFRSPMAILFSLLLFFQFGNEWAIAGWLPLLLIQRLGISPTKALLILALYWSALWLGRVAAQWMIQRGGHGRLLMASALAAMLGCLVLALTNNTFGACLGVVLLGLGFAVVYPLVVEKIGARFPHYHPGLFNGIFSFALTGAMLAPWMVGFAADAWGIQMVMALPALGTFMVVLLLLVIWLETKLTGVPNSSW